MYGNTRNGVYNAMENIVFKLDPSDFQYAHYSQNVCTAVTELMFALVQNFSLELLLIMVK